MSSAPSPPDPSAIRVSDADRERVATILGEHCAHGRLTLDELTERLETTYAARTVGELERATHDLPGPAPRAPTQPTDAAEARWSSVAILGKARRTGRWRLPAHTTALTVLGETRLDLREAVIETSEVVVTAMTVLGELEVIVPEGVEVALEGLTILGERKHHGQVTPNPGAPVVRLRAFTLLGEVRVRTRPPRRLDRGDGRRALRDERRALRDERRAERREARRGRSGRL